jgi:hypothetical protein
MNSTNTTAGTGESGLGSVQLTLVINAIAGSVFVAVFFLILRPWWALHNVPKRRKLFRRFIQERKVNGSAIPEEECPINLEEELRDHNDAYDFLNDVHEKYIVNIPVIRTIEVTILFIVETTLTLIWPEYQERDKKRNVRFYGRDLAVYLSFQQKILYCFFIILLLSVAIIIPVHVTGVPSEQFAILLAQDDDVLAHLLIKIHHPH